MLKIRLSRTGKRNDASFRIVVTEHYKPVKAGFIEHIGFYNPQSKQFQIDKEKLETWMKKGATCSTTVNNLLVREKIFAKDKILKITRVPKKKDEEENKSAKGGSASGGKGEEEKKEKKTEAMAETTEKKEETKAETKEESKPISNQKSQISNKSPKSKSQKK